MDPPVPKPRSTLGSASEPAKRPVPLPRTKVPPSMPERVSASDLIRSIGSVSKQIGEEVALKVQSSAKSANEKLEKSIIDGSKFAKGTLEKTISTSRAMRDSVTKSVIEGTKTASMRLRRSKKSGDCISEVDAQRCVSMPVVDVSLFENIQFHSPMMDLKKLKNNEFTSMNINSSNFDDESLFSSASDSNPDNVSNFSYDSRDNEPNISGFTPEEDTTYDTPQNSRANSVVGIPPDIPERRKKRESKIDFMKQNSLYENWLLPGEPQYPPPQRVSHSTIFEFDPLNTSSVPKYEGISNEQLLESILTGDTYGTLIGSDNSDDHFEDHYGETDYFNPPTPPERTDSLFPEEAPATTETIKENSSNWFINDEDSVVAEETSKATNSSVMQKFSNMLKLDGRNKSASKQSVPKIDTVERPSINQLIPYYSGVLTRIVSGPSGVEDLFHKSQSRYCVLSDMKLNCYSDPTNTVLKEFYPLESVYSVQIVLPLSSSSNNSFCLELSVGTGARGAPRKLMFSCSSASERRNWAQKLAEGLASGFQPKYTAEFTRCGWCYLKCGVSGEWQGAWVMLIRRVLVYGVGDQLKTIDLRKTRCVVTRDAEEETRKLCPNDGSPNLLLDCPQATLYLRFPHDRELKDWRYMVKLAAHNNGAYIHHQQLTKDDVPTIVDKCISFIYAHGSLTEGIYRRAGSSSVLAELLVRFRRDAWAVQLSAGSHSEHDASGVLRRFFRDLPEPLLPRAAQPALRDALLIEDTAARHSEYRRVLSTLPLVARNTTRKLFAHLHFIHSLSDVNKMTAENLASVWAPTIMPAALTSDMLPVAWSSKEVFVIRELIGSFAAVWQPSAAELRREEAVRRVLRGAAARPAPPCPAGDLRAWLYVHDRSTHYQVTLTPHKTSADVCVELSERAKTESHLLMVEEVVCGGAMRRVLPLDEPVLHAVLRWGYWDEADRRDNYLLVRENKELHEMEALRPATSSVCGELKFANESAKNFKSHMFEFQNGKLSYFKDKQGSHKLEEWNIKDILWYTGHEPKRNPQTRWSITFIPRNSKPNRSKERPWFGCTLAGAVTEDQLKWTSAMTFAEHQQILPTPRLVIT